MASSSDSMDDESFRARVDRIFGSLPAGLNYFRQPSSAVRSSPWSLTGKEVERKEWRRDTGSSDRDETPCSAAFDDFLNKDRRSSRRNAKLGGELGGDLDDVDEDGDERPENGDEWDIRSSIGLDPTLDNEEEEDEYDKVACGRESADDRLYTRDVTNHGLNLNAENVLLNSLSSTMKDPRDLAARNRLMEDDAEAQVSNSPHNPGTEFKEPQVRFSGDGVPLRSILKRKDTNSIPKSLKRVRFDPGCMSSSEELSEGHQDFLSRNSSVSSMVSSNDGSMLAQNTARIQDRSRNAYTHYTLNSTIEVNEESNTRACMDFLKLVRGSKPSDLGSNSQDVSADLPKSITFIPKKKAVDGESVDSFSEFKQDKQAKSSHQAEFQFPIGIALIESQQSEVGEVVEAQQEVSATDVNSRIQKPIRRYRTKPSSDDSDC
ncbi:hypothetical protein HS088_TW06G00547 [Tripterygium wilfordii]|uniref:Protein TSSC4 n=1 Tax=Tripterygium wilfordii TaxID=458696 RepID=A0A7J7DJX1_TRIWF|nr:uncharacterized protein LOC119999421 [Tripterygium wilfordii]KAF5746376.1 hypothetical protein HS088_TW06G00547 [Tripterygium wilfordii]